jgi:hypothetical protein
MCEPRPAGYASTMTEPVKDLAKEAQAGRSPRTPALALTGVAIVVAVIVAVILVVAFAAYYLTK